MISKENENPRSAKNRRHQISKAAVDRAVEEEEEEEEEEAVQEQVVETRSLVQPGECSGVRDRIVCVQQAGVKPN